MAQRNRENAMAKKNPVTYKEFDINVGLSYAGSEEQYVKFLKRYFRGCLET